MVTVYNTSELQTLQKLPCLPSPRNPGLGSHQWTVCRASCLGSLSPLLKLLLYQFSLPCNSFLSQVIIRETSCVTESRRSALLCPWIVKIVSDSACCVCVCVYTSRICAHECFMSETTHNEQAIGIHTYCLSRGKMRRGP